MSVAARPLHSGRPQPVLYVAAAGWGKSAALEAVTGGERPLDAAEVLARPGLLDGREVVAVDDVDRLDPHAQLTLLTLLDRVPAAVHLAGRTGPATEARRGLSVPLRLRSAADLALDDAAIARVLRDEHSVDDGAAPPLVRSLTGGWPALVHLAADELDRIGAPLDAVGLTEALTAPETPGRWWLESHVLSELTPEAQDLLAAVAPLDVVTPDLVSALLGDDRAPWTEVVRELAVRGLLTHAPWPWTRAYRVVPAVAALLTTSSSRSSRNVSVAADWFGAHDMAAQHVTALESAGRQSEARRAAVSHADAILGSGGADDVVRLLSAASDLTDDALLVLGDALRIIGAAPEALRVLGSVDRTSAVPSGLLWRLARVHYSRGEYAATVEVLDELSPADEAPGDLVRSLACRAHALALLGRVDEAADAAAQAVLAAETAGDPRNTATAHLAAAAAATGPERESHLSRAARAAESVGDAIQAARALVNQACALLAAARYAEARESARRAVEIAETGSPTGLMTVALHNLAEAECRTGHVEEAGVVLRRALALCSDQGSARAAFGLLGLAEVEAGTGRQDQAALHFRAAIDVARRNGEVQVLVQSLSGLARLLCWDPARRDEAAAAAGEAVEVATEEFAPFAALAAGWVAHTTGDADAASVAAESAAAAARELGWLDLLADALELRGCASSEPGEARNALTAALPIWVDGGAEPAADRLRVLLGRLPDADAGTRLAGQDAARRLQRSGLPHLHGQSLDDAGAEAEVAIRLHGPFQVTVRGRPVPVQAWRSRQARTLLKVLAARSGRAATRAELCHLLWPDDDPTKTGHRLSVLLSAVRSVLDPERRRPVDRFVTADLGGLALDLRHVRVDLDQLLRDEAQSQRLLRDGDHDLAERLLGDLVGSYPGPALEDEQDEEWAVPVREESRATLHRCLWNLAGLHQRRGQDASVVGLLVRLLRDDAYDEDAHRGLVRALMRRGSHGEARRAFERWADAMRQIDAPAPDARVLTVAPSVPRPRRPAVLTS